MFRRGWRTTCALVVVVLCALGVGGAAAGAFDWSADAPILKPGTRPPNLDEEAEERLIDLDKEFIANRTPARCARAPPASGTACGTRGPRPARPPSTAPGRTRGRARWARSPEARAA